MSGCGSECGTCVCEGGASAGLQRPAPRLADPFAAAGDDSATAVAELARAVADELRSAGVPSPDADAARLLSHVLDRSTAELVVAPAVGAPARDAVLAAAARRARREPLQHILGEAAFRYLDLHVGPGVFVPRPETEVVVEAALQRLPKDGPAVVVDLGAGSGAISLALGTERPDTTVYAVELDAGALPWLTQNVMRHAEALRQRNSRILVVLGDAGAVSRPDQPLAKLVGAVHLVVANPPYIPDAALPRDPEVRDHDPQLALFGGPDGLDQVRRWLDTAADLLAPGAALVLEHGDLQGGDDGVPGLLARHEDLASRGPVWRDVADHLDLAGRSRYTTAARAIA
jgi:release factor glutamine methyltransferase